MSAAAKRTSPDVKSRVRKPRRPPPAPLEPTPAGERKAARLETENGDGETRAEQLWRDEFRERLRVSVALIGLSNRRIAKELNCSEQRFYNWVALEGSAIPQMYYLVRYCKRFGISPSYLLLGEVSALTKRLADDLERASEVVAEARRERERTRS